MRRRYPPRTALVAVLLVGALALAGVAGAQATTLFHDGDEISLEAGEGQAIRGQTALDPGSTVTVRVESEDAASPFLSRPQATVDEDGRFTAYVDLSHLDPGTNASVTVRHDGETLAEADATVGPCRGGCKPAATFDRDGENLTLRTGPGQAVAGRTSLDEDASVTVRVESNSSSQPFLVTREAIVRDDGRFSTHLDLSDLDPGTSFTVSVLHDGERLNGTSGELVPCDGECEPVATDTPTATPTIDTSEFGFQSVVEVENGETARIPVALGDADAATLSIGGPDVNYVVNVTVRDGDGDSRVDLLFDTGAAGVDERTLGVADEDDELTVTDPEPDLGSSIESTEYDMRLYAGESATGDSEHVGLLVVLEPAPGRDDGPSLGKAVTSVQRGDDAAIPVRLGDGGVATVSIHRAGVEYSLNATVSDGDGDGRVDLTFRTSAAGTDRTTLVTASDADAVTVTGPEPSLDGPLPATEYDVDLYPGNGTSGDAASIGTLSVREGGETRTAALADSRSADGGIDLAGVGALAAGAIFAVAGVGLLLGLFRS